MELLIGSEYITRSGQLVLVNEIAKNNSQTYFSGEIKTIRYMWKADGTTIIPKGDESGYFGTEHDIIREAE